MAWITPKTNWKSTDYFNISDWNRLANNVDFVWNLFSSVVGLPDAYRDESVYYQKLPTKTYSSEPYASEWNALEDYIAFINFYSYKLDLGDSLTYFANGQFPNFEDFNRIEKALETLKLTIESQRDNREHIPIVLGIRKGLA